MDIHSIYHPFQRYFRTRRMQQFWRRFRVTSHTRVLDVGGAPFNWSLLSRRPRLYILNLDFPNTRNCDAIRWIVANGCQLPFRDGSFDIVYSNSVIEHLRTLDKQSLFAQECQRVGIGYYVQTPNKWFPIEPHFIAPFIHWLPRWLQVYLLRNFTIRGLVARPSRTECLELLDELRLLDEGELRRLFPDADIWHERLLGLIKSLIAVRIRSSY